MSAKNTFGTEMPTSLLPRAAAMTSAFSVSTPSFEMLLTGTTKRENERDEKGERERAEVEVTNM